MPGTAAMVLQPNSAAIWQNHSARCINSGQSFSATKVIGSRALILTGLIFRVLRKSLSSAIECFSR